MRCSCIRDSSFFLYQRSWILQELRIGISEILCNVGYQNNDAGSNKENSAKSHQSQVQICWFAIFHRKNMLNFPDNFRFQQHCESKQNENNNPYIIHCCYLPANSNMQPDLYKESISHDNRQFHIRYTLTVQLNKRSRPTPNGFAKLCNIKRERCNYCSAPLFALIKLV